MKPRQAKEVLDYFMLSPEDKIKYREERGISLKDLYQSWKPPQVNEPIQKKLIMDLTNMLDITYYPLQRAGYFGETKTTNNPNGGGLRTYISKDDANRILRDEWMLIPVRLFYERLKSEKWYFHRNFFDDVFERSFIKLEGRKPLYLSVSETARIAAEMRKRKAMVEDWKTIRDHAAELGLEIKDKTITSKYSRLADRGEIKLTRVNNYGSKNRKGFCSWQYKIDPAEYRRNIAVGKAELNALEFDYSTARLSEALDLNITNVETAVKIGTELGLLHPVAIRLFAEHGYNRYMIPANEAERWIRGEIKIPSKLRYDRLIQDGKTPEEINGLVKDDAELVKIKDIVERTGLTRSYVNQLIHAGIELGILSDKSIRYVGGSRPYRHVLLPEDAEIIIQRRLLIPNIRRFRATQQEQDLQRTLPSSNSQNDLEAIAETELWINAKHGDQKAFNIILESYKPVIQEIARRYRFGSQIEERENFLYTELFNLITEAKATTVKREQVIQALKNRLSEIVRIERPSWLSPDIFLDNDDKEARRIDLFKDPREESRQKRRLEDNL